MSKAGSAAKVKLSSYDDLFGNTEENKKQQKLDSVLDGLNEKYGYNFVKRAGKMNVDKKIFDNFRKKF